MKYLLLTLALFGSVSMFAQVDEEAYYLTGGLGFTSSDATMDYTSFNPITGEPITSSMAAKNNNFNIRVGGGYMFTEMFGAGLNIGFNSNKMSPEIDSLAPTMTTTIFSIAPEARMYLEIDEPLYFTGIFQVGMGFGTNKMESDGLSFDQSFSTFDVGVRPGLSYFMSDNLALDLSVGYIGYAVQSQEVDNPLGEGTITSSTGSFQFVADMSSVTFGLTLMLNN